MLTPTLHTAAILAATPAPPAGPTGGNGVTSLLVDTILPIVLLVIAIGVVAKAGKKDHKGTMQIVAIVGFGLIIVGVALSGGVTGLSIALWNIVKTPIPGL